MDPSRKDRRSDFDRSAKKAQKSVAKKQKKAQRHEDKKRLDSFIGDYTTGRKDYDDYSDKPFYD
jgi:hypothetical protein